MRSSRVALAAAVTLSVIALAGCAPQSPEEKAKQMFRDFVKSTTQEGPEILYCDDGEHGGGTVPFELVEGAEITVKDANFYGKTPGKLDVRAVAKNLETGVEDEVSMFVIIRDGEEPCYEATYGI